MTEGVSWKETLLVCQRFRGILNVKGGAGEEGDEVAVAGTMIVGFGAGTL
jgi:hypothetical protein